MKITNFKDLEYSLLKYLLKNGGRPDEIDISPFLKKNIKTDFQFVYSRLEHNLNASGLAKIRVFQKKDEKNLPYSMFLGTLTENGKIYLEESFKNRENRWIKIGTFSTTIISVIISAISLYVSYCNSDKNTDLENRVYQLEQNSKGLNDNKDSLIFDNQNLFYFVSPKKSSNFSVQVKDKLLKIKDRQEK